MQALLKKNASDDVALHCMGRIYVAMDKSGRRDRLVRESRQGERQESRRTICWLGNALGEQAQHTNKLKLPFLARRIKSEFEKARRSSIRRRSTRATA